MRVLPISDRVRDYLKMRQLEKKFAKQLNLLENNLKHPGLNVELLEPRELQIYSFRLDRKYRVLFFFPEPKSTIKIMQVTDHYHK